MHCYWAAGAGCTQWDILLSTAIGLQVLGVHYGIYYLHCYWAAGAGCTLWDILLHCYWAAGAGCTLLDILQCTAIGLQVLGVHSWIYYYALLWSYRCWLLGVHYWIYYYVPPPAQKRCIHTTHTKRKQKHAEARREAPPFIAEHVTSPVPQSVTWGCSLKGRTPSRVSRSMGGSLGNSGGSTHPSRCPQRSRVRH